MVYKVTFAPQAKQDLDNILTYCIKEFENFQAASNIFNDVENAKLRLSQIADGLKIRDDLEGSLRTIKLKHHKYLMIYKIINNNVWVLRIFHTSQDISSKLKNLK